MTAEEFILENLISMGEEEDDPSIVMEEDAFEAIDLAEKEVAQQVHRMISEGATVSEIDSYVTNICEL